MRKSKFLIQTLAVALAATLGLSQAQAAYETFQIGNGGLESFGLTWDGHSESALAGGITLTRVSGGTIPSFVSVCTDIGGTVYLGSQYGYSAPTVFNNQDGVVPSWGAGNAGIPLDTPWTSLTVVQQNNAAAAIQAAADIFYHHQGVLTGNNVSDKAALQLAVWEALYDTTAGSSTLGFGMGRFRVSSGDSAAISQATTWLGQVDANARYTGFLLIPDNHTAQEMFYNVTPVPEPTTMIAGALLLLPFGASTLRFVRRKRAA
jgi:hypothetical protein